MDSGSSQQWRLELRMDSSFCWNDGAMLPASAIFRFRTVNILMPELLCAMSGDQGDVESVYAVMVVPAGTISNPSPAARPVDGSVYRDAVVSIAAPSVTFHT